MTARSDMARDLTLGASTPTKTFVLEVHTDAPVDYLGGLVGSGNIESTEDAFLYKIYLSEGVFWVDQLDDRFWSFHTNMPAAAATACLSRYVNTRHDLDWIWLPSDHLRHVWPGATSRKVRTNFEGSRLLGDAATVYDVKVQLSGENAEELLDYISQEEKYKSAISFDGVQVALNDPNLGFVQEAVNRMGRFAVSGNSLEFHLQFVRGVVHRYRKFVTLCEERSFSWAPFDQATSVGGGRFEGCPITLNFSREIPNMEAFLDELFSSRTPFRLWGNPRLEGDVAEVDAVDLHVGNVLQMDIGKDWMRVYLPRGACGNTITRLVSNLQHRFDGALYFSDPDLQAALRARTANMPG